MNNKDLDYNNINKILRDNFLLEDFFESRVFKNRQNLIAQETRNSKNERENFTKFYDKVSSLEEYVIKNIKLALNIYKKNDNIESILFVIAPNLSKDAKGENHSVNKVALYELQSYIESKNLEIMPKFFKKYFRSLLDCLSGNTKKNDAIVRQFIKRQQIPDAHSVSVVPLEKEDYEELGFYSQLDLQNYEKDEKTLVS